jgi:hypothetical protein
LEAKEICNRKTRKNIRATGSRTSEKEWKLPTCVLWEWWRVFHSAKGIFNWVKILWYTCFIEITICILLQLHRWYNVSVLYLSVLDCTCVQALIRSNQILLCVIGTCCFLA